MAITSELRGMSPPRLKRAEYMWFRLRFRAKYWANCLAASVNLPRKTSQRRSALTPEELKADAEAQNSVPMTYKASNSDEINMVMACMTGTHREEFYKSLKSAINVDATNALRTAKGDPAASDFEHYVAKKASSTRAAKYIKSMYHLRKDPDKWEHMSVDELSNLWAPSFHYMEKLVCFISAPATLFSIQTVTAICCVVIFTALLAEPEFTEGPMQKMPWQEVYIILIMAANLVQVSAASR